MLRDASLHEGRAHWEAECRAAGCPERTPVVEVDVRQALGEVLAAPLHSLIANPPASVAAMDGIAVRGWSGGGAVLAPEAFALVDTGQAIPPGFDAVARIEQVRLEDDGSASVEGRVERGANVRAAGELLALGQRLVPAGRPLGPFDVAVAIAGGHRQVAVHRRPRVAVIPTGDELRAAGDDLEAGTVHDSNGPMIAAQVQEAGAETHVTAACRDDPGAIAELVADAAARADVVLLLGGSSRGRRDHALAALERVGRAVVDGVAIRPGHPLLLGLAGTAPVMGVPGYPFAAAIAVHVLVLPRLHALRGVTPAPHCLDVRLAEDVDGRPGADSFVPLRLLDGHPPRAVPLGRRGSDIAALAAADALLRLDPDGALAAGTVVAVEWLGG